MGRLQSMGTLYDQLYRGVDFRAMSFKDYLPSLLRTVTGNFPDSGRVRLEADCDGTQVDVKTLSVLGIIVNELVTNAMKYAFPGGRPGVVGIHARGQGRHRVVRVYDDGVGLPEGFDPSRSAGFGMGLVRSLSDQIEARLSIGHGPGSSFTLEFDEAD